MGAYHGYYRQRGSSLGDHSDLECPEDTQQNSSAQFKDPHPPVHKYHNSVYHHHRNTDPFNIGSICDYNNEIPEMNSSISPIGNQPFQLEDANDIFPPQQEPQVCSQRMASKDILPDWPIDLGQLPLEGIFTPELEHTKEPSEELEGDESWYTFLFSSLAL